MRLLLIILPILIVTAFCAGYQIVSEVQVSANNPYFIRLEGMPFVSR